MKKVTLFLLALTVRGVLLRRFLKADQAAPEEVCDENVPYACGKGVDQR
ncbi:hypothetical protein [Peribacillus simplex]|uniref:Uncharacterized protein n=1 Tax=Peribacillus simplex TaxID=1478 RepID=A0AAW7I7M2_9BACI|nr:hypothetical protein [Peribacillus simplex]MDM5452035.1 hypothetical protein [Peribacillus simplex]